MQSWHSDLRNDKKISLFVLKTIQKGEKAATHLECSHSLNMNVNNILLF